MHQELTTDDVIYGRQSRTFPVDSKTASPIYLR